MLLEETSVTGLVDRCGSMLLEQKTSFSNNIAWLAGSLVGLSGWLAVLPGELTEWLFWL
jgi:hypothetical protein